MMADPGSKRPRRLDPRLAVAAVVVMVAMAAGAWGLSVRGQQQRRQAALESQIERAVRAYDERLIQVLMTADPRVMAGLVGSVEDQRLTAFAIRLRGEGRVMGSRLDALKLVSVVESGVLTVTAVTEEDWRYQDYDPRTKKPLGPVTKERQRLRYRLARVNGRWRIESVEAE